MVIVLWCIFEILFYFYFVYSRNRLQAQTKPKIPLSQLERSNLFWNCLQTIDDISSWSEGWFYYKKDHSHPKFKDIQRDNLAVWFAWAFWHDHLDNVLSNEAWAIEMEWMLSSAEDYFHIKFPPGQNKELQCIRLHLDPVQACHRPLLLYVGVYCLTKLFELVCLQWAWSFIPSKHTSSNAVWGGILGLIDDTVQQFFEDKKQDRFSNLSYFYRPSSSNNQTPLVFLHGIGAGVLCYAEFIHYLTRLDRPIFLVELPYVAMRMVDDVPSASETVEEIKLMLNIFGYQDAVYVSHSLGTGVSSWIMNKAPETVAGLVMIDPICFLLHYHHVAFNFVHRLPETLFQHILYYVASRELYISNYISRHFQWFETIYFSQPNPTPKLPKLPSPLDTQNTLANATVFLSEKDGIVGSPVIYDYLSQRGVDVRLMEGLEHAMFLSSSNWKKTISNQIDYIARKADNLKQ